jgi:hypothetical protein
MKSTLIVFALLLLVPFTPAAEPLPSPGVEVVAAGCAPCVKGDRATSVLHVVNPGDARGVLLAATLRHPNGVLYPLPASGSVLIPAGSSSITLADFIVFGGDAGVYLITAAILDPVTGRDLARDVLGVAKE